ncbi:PREDICTED: uncharacterized protein LOC105853451 [Condylura cristata]|uniref:uncharacterized protein LOC105853451 n=1 Tax=Condylura cristata TaxID=143302 RepID=UPI000642CD6A|nr:PREDICTED: uncharacterized protein LOC105853451 [Condylura cristata]
MAFREPGYSCCSVLARGGAALLRGGCGVPPGAISAAPSLSSLISGSLVPGLVGRLPPPLGALLRRDPGVSLQLRPGAGSTWWSGLAPRTGPSPLPAWKAGCPSPPAPSRLPGGCPCASRPPEGCGWHRVQRAAAWQEAHPDFMSRPQGSQVCTAPGVGHPVHLAPSLSSTDHRQVGTECFSGTENKEGSAGTHSHLCGLLPQGPATIIPWRLAFLRAALSLGPGVHVLSPTMLALRGRREAEHTTHPRLQPWAADAQEAGIGVAEGRALLREKATLPSGQGAPFPESLKPWIALPGPKSGFSNDPFSLVPNIHLATGSASLEAWVRVLGALLDPSAFKD